MITANKLNVGSLSAITGNIGNITSGEITGTTIHGGQTTLDSSGLTMTAGSADSNKVKWSNGGYVFSNGNQMIFGNGVSELWWENSTLHAPAGGGKLGANGLAWDAVYVSHLYVTPPTDPAGSYDLLMLNPVDNQVHRAVGAYTGDIEDVNGNVFHVTKGVITGVN